jgi:hypothetical protein
VVEIDRHSMPTFSDLMQRIVLAIFPRKSSVRGMIMAFADGD